jgi:hypothetical protein
VSSDSGYDLDSWLPAGRDPAEYAVELLRSTHLPDVHAAEQWLLTHRSEALPALVAGLETPSAQACAVLLGRLQAVTYLPDLVAAHRRGGMGLQSSVEAALEAMDDPRAGEALQDLQGGQGPQGPEGSASV